MTKKFLPDRGLRVKPGSRGLVYMLFPGRDDFFGGEGILERIALSPISRIADLVESPLFILRTASTVGTSVVPCLPIIDSECPSLAGQTVGVQPRLSSRYPWVNVGHVTVALEDCYRIGPNPPPDGVSRKFDQHLHLSPR